MKRQLFAFLFTIPVLIFSCQKETQDIIGDNTIQAKNLTNVSYGSSQQQQMDVYLPKNRTVDSTKSLVLIHGGAWATGDKADFGSFIDSLKQRLPGYALFNINYRLSAPPANVFPTQEEDVKAALNFINDKRNEYLVSDNVVLLGVSAGGHLALLHAYKNTSPFQIKAVIDFFGPTDLVDLYNNPGTIPDYLIAQVIGTTPTANPGLYQSSSPINFVSNARPTIILQGTADPLVNYISQSRALRDQLEAAGKPVQYVEYEGLGHGDDWSDADFTDAFNKIQGFLETYNP